MNMERWRWAPRDLGDRYILINVPSYQLQVMEGDKPALAMRVIVGQPDHQTPLFSDEMTYVVFSPYWNIPPDILRDETLPRVASDPDYLQRNNIEVVGTSGKDEVVDPSDDRLVGRGRDEGAAVPPDARPGERARPREVHLPEPLQRLPARHAGRRAVLQGAPHPEPRLRPRRATRWRSRSTCCGDRPEWTGPRIREAMDANKEQTVTLEAAAAACTSATGRPGSSLTARR